MPKLPPFSSPNEAELDPARPVPLYPPLAPTPLLHKGGHARTTDVDPVLKYHAIRERLPPGIPFLQLFLLFILATVLILLKVFG